MLSSESRNEVVDYIMTESQLAGTFSWYSSESHIFNLTAGKYQYILVLSLTKKKMRFMLPIIHSLTLKKSVYSLSSLDTFSFSIPNPHCKVLADPA